MRSGRDTRLDRETIIAKVVEPDLNKAEREYQRRVAIDEFRQGTYVLPNAVACNQQKEAA
jgi:hypothetical protein